jgi:23S rRNA (guanosine2251-2'-O)-methyltransferase
LFDGSNFSDTLIISPTRYFRKLKAMLPIQKQTIYQCKNPECKFRFPLPPNTGPISACPQCGSPLHQIDYPITHQTGYYDHQWYPVRHVEALLDNLRGTFNVGAIFRTSDGAGIKHLYLCGSSPTPVHPKVAKTSLGAEQSVSWSYHPNSVAIAQTKLDEGFSIAALETGSDSISLFDQGLKNMPARILLVIGNEVSGVDPGLIALSRWKINIPMHGYKKSLNVAVAYGIAAYLIRQLGI